MGRRAQLKLKDGRLGEVLAGGRYLVIDGAMGTMLIAGGHEEANTHPELLCLSNSEAVTGVHRAYVEAGADIVTLNTFGANERKLAGKASVEDVWAAAAKCARDAGAPYLAGDLGPTGELMAPYGDLGFEEAYGLFAQEVRAGVAAGCDLFLVETMTDLLEAKAAVLAVTENSDLPLVAMMTFGENGRTLMGTTPAIAAATLAQLGADAVGMNCSLGPGQVAGIARELNENAPVPVAVEPNAGLPVTRDGVTTYDIDAASFASSYGPILEAGTRLVGSCCGSTPDFTRALSGLVAGKAPEVPVASPGLCATSSRKLAAIPDWDVAAIAETVNPDGGTEKLSRKLKRCRSQVAAIELAGFGEDDLRELAATLEGYGGTPLWLKTDDPAVAEPLVRPYAGCPVIGMGEGEPPAGLRELAERYGCPLA